MPIKVVTRKSRRKFPAFAVILLLISISWLLNDLRIITINLPWLPIILGVVAISWIIDRYS